MRDKHQDRHHDKTLQREVHEAGDEKVEAMYRSRSDLHAVLLLREWVGRSCMSST